VQTGHHNGHELRPDQGSFIFSPTVPASIDGRVRDPFGFVWQANGQSYLWVDTHLNRVAFEAASPHEMGHLFGFDPVPGTVMDARLDDRLRDLPQNEAATNDFTLELVVQPDGLYVSSPLTDMFLYRRLEGMLALPLGVAGEETSRGWHSGGRAAGASGPSRSTSRCTRFASGLFFRVFADLSGCSRAVDGCRALQRQASQ